MLNAAELALDSAEIDGANPRPCTVELDDEFERLIITLPEPVAPGALTLRCAFEAR